MENCVIGIEIGGTKLQAALGTADGAILDLRKTYVDVERGHKGILDWLAAEIPDIIDAAQKQNKKVCAVGIGFGGPVDTPTGVIICSVHVNGWNGFALRGWIQERFGVPCVLLNDTNAACYGEYRNGIGQGADIFCYSNIGSGIGGGLVLKGELYDGQGYGGMEIGQSFVPDWTVDESGKEQKLELICSGWSIEKRLRSEGYIPSDSMMLSLAGGDLSKITCRILGKAAYEHDRFALEEIRRIARTLGIAYSNIINFICPEIIAVGGGVSNLGDMLLDPLREEVESHVFGSNIGKYEIQQCRLGETIVLAGAMLCAGEIIS